MAKSVVFLTDFGLLDDYVGQLHAAVLKRDLSIQRVDLCHEIPPGDIGAGSFLLLTDFNHLPEDCVVVGVVDPGVGTERRIVALPCEGNRWLVGPDNGLLEPTYRAYGNGDGVVIQQIPGGLDAVSKTFHGRDLMVPAAMHLALGGEPGQLGAKIGPEELVEVALDPIQEGNSLLAEIFWVDRFGNLITNLASDMVAGAVLEGPDGEIERVDTFAEAEENVPVWLIGSRGTVEIVANNGSAAMLTGLGRGDKLVARRN